MPRRATGDGRHPKTFTKPAMVAWSPNQYCHRPADPTRGLASSKDAPGAGCDQY